MVKAKVLNSDELIEVIRQAIPVQGNEIEYSVNGVFVRSSTASLEELEKVIDRLLQKNINTQNLKDTTSYIG